jgi:GxxExxY protein
MQPQDDVPYYLNEISRGVIGAAIQVHSVLGRGFLESIYEMAMVEELTARNILFDRQVSLPVMYRQRVIGEHRLDLLVGGELVVELKAVAKIADAHVAQTLSYMKAGAFRLGLILNFNVTMMRDGIRRVVSSG